MSIPSQEQALVAESPPYNVAASRTSSIPGLREPAVKVTYYVRRRIRNGVPPSATHTAGQGPVYVSVHEVWPNHCLQSGSNANLAHRRALVNYAFGEVEHYAEEMMYDAGLGQDSPRCALAC
jgi:hypothetical protein